MEPVTVGNNVWIEGRSVICPDVNVSDNSFIAAGSVVVTDVPANVVVVRTSANIIRYMKGADLS